MSITSENQAMTEKVAREDAARLSYHRHQRDFHKPLLDKKGALHADGSIRGFHTTIEMHVDAVDRLDAALSENERLRADNARLVAHLHDEHCCQHDLSEPSS